VDLFKATTLRTYHIPGECFPGAQGFAELAERNLVHAIRLKILVIVGVQKLVSCVHPVNELGG
jgi:hypothetical protein